MDMQQAPSDSGGGTLYAFALQQKNQGVDAATLTDQLVAKGMTPERASEMVRSLYKTAPAAAGARAARAVGAGSLSLTRTVLAAVLAAIVGGVVWGFIVRLTNFEIGYMAVGVGALVGFAALMATPEEHRHVVHIPYIAVAASFLGIFLGKYATFWFVMAAMSDGAVSSLNAITPKGFSFFMSEFSSMIDPFDFLWMFLAFSAAYRIAGQGGDGVD